MAELSLMASAAFSPGIFYQDHGLYRPSKVQALLPGHGKRHDILRSGCMPIGAPHVKDPWQFTSLLSEYNQLSGTTPMIQKPVLIDLQDARPDSVLFSFGVTEQCTRHEKILKFLTSESSIADGEDLNISLLSDLMGFHTVAIDMCPQPHVLMEDKFCLYEVGMDDHQQFIHPQMQLCAPKSLLNFVGTLSHTSAITVHPNGNVLFPGSEGEMKDLLSIFAEFNLSKNLSNGSKKAMVVPYFNRKRGVYAWANSGASSSKFETQTVAPLNSSRNSKTKPLPKKKQNRKPGRERDIFSRSYFHACESLLNVYLDKKGDRMAILSLKNSGPELTQLLYQFSAGIAGTGLAVLFSVACKLVGGRVLPLSSAKLFNVSFGFGLFWLSWAVNRLRDTIDHFSNKSSRDKKPEEVEVIARKVERSVNEILIRAATLMAVVVIRFG